MEARIDIERGLHDLAAIATRADIQRVQLVVLLRLARVIASKREAVHE